MNTDINNEKLSFKSMYDLVEEFDAHNKPGIKTGLKEFDDLVGGEFIMQPLKQKYRTMSNKTKLKIGEFSKGKVYALSSTPDMCAVDFAYLVLNIVANKHFRQYIPTRQQLDSIPDDATYIFSPRAEI